jgi:hypothetical protein|tara:strand:- start:26577 stop:27062 length:486 start_codon:yes stop_codon:yes gene_type:complete
MAKDDLKNSVRETRAAQSRDRNVRNKPWQPPSVLDAPDAPEGYVYRWIRESMVGNDDKANMSKRIREGWEPVRAEEHPDFETPVVEEGKYAGVIGVGGLILAKMPIEIVEQRKAYFRNMTSDQIQAVDRNLMRESNPVMPIETPQRSTKVTFGSGGSKGES